MFNLLLIILEQLLLHLPLIVGAYISLSLLKVPDLSLESAYLAGALTGSYAMLVVTNLPIILQIGLVVGASLAGGAIIGIFSSLLTQKGRLPHLLSSIITFGIFHGLYQLVAPSYLSLSQTSSPIAFLDYLPRYPELPVLLLLNLGTLLIICFVFTRQIGYAYVVYGNNPNFFKNYQISSSFIFMSGIILANALAGFGGFLFAQSNSFVELNMGLGKALLTISTLILGKQFLSRTKAAIVIPLFGALIYFSLQQILLKFGFNLKYFTAIQALLICAILLVTYRKNSRLLNNDNLGL